MWVSLIRFVILIASYFWDVGVDILVAREQIPQAFPYETPIGRMFDYVLSPRVWLSFPPDYNAIHLFLTWLWIVSGGAGQFLLLAWHMLRRGRAKKVIPTPWLVAALVGSAIMLGPTVIYFFCLFTLIQNRHRPEDVTGLVSAAAGFACSAKLAEIFAESLPQFCTQLIMTSAKGQEGVRSLSFAQMISVCSSAVTLCHGLTEFILVSDSGGGGGDDSGDALNISQKPKTSGDVSDGDGSDGDGSDKECASKDSNGGDDENDSVHGRFDSPDRPAWITRLIIVVFLISEVVVLGGICRFSCAIYAPTGRLPTIAVFVLPPAFFVTLVVLVDLVRHKSIFRRGACVVFLVSKVIVFVIIISFFIADVNIRGAKLPVEFFKSLNNNNSLWTFVTTILVAVFNAVVGFLLFKEEFECRLFKLLTSLWEKRPYDLRVECVDRRNAANESEAEEKEGDGTTSDGTSEKDEDAKIDSCIKCVNHPINTEPTPASALWLLFVVPIILIILIPFIIVPVENPEPDYYLEFHSDCYTDRGFPLVAKTDHSPRGSICVFNRNVSQITWLGRIVSKKLLKRQTDALLVGNARFLEANSLLQPVCDGEENRINDCWQYGLGVALSDECYENANTLYVSSVAGVYENVSYYYHGDALTWLEAHQFCLANGGVLATGSAKAERDAMAATLTDVKEQWAWLGVCCEGLKCGGVVAGDEDETEFDAIKQAAGEDVIDGISKALLLSSDGAMQAFNFLNAEFTFFCKLSNESLSSSSSSSSMNPSLVLSSGCSTGFALSAPTPYGPWEPTCSGGKGVEELALSAASHNNSRLLGHRLFFGIRRLPTCEDKARCFGYCTEYLNGTQCHELNNCFETNWSLFVEFRRATSLEDTLTRVFHSESLIWYQALDACAREGAQLASTATEPASKALKETVLKSGSKARRIWTGLRRLKKPWNKWVQFGPSDTISPWSPGEPDDLLLHSAPLYASSKKANYDVTFPRRIIDDAAAVLDVESGLIEDEARSREFPFVCERPTLERNFNVDVEGSSFSLHFGRRSYYVAEKFCELRSAGAKSRVAVFDSDEKLRVIISLLKEAGDYLSRVGYEDDPKFWTGAVQWDDYPCCWHWRGSPETEEISWELGQPDGHTKDGVWMAGEKVAVINKRGSFEDDDPRSSFFMTICEILNYDDDDEELGVGS